MIWLAFLSEFLALAYLASDRRRWVREHQLEIAIVLLTPPFLLAALQPIRALRLLRPLRLIRLAQASRKVFSLEGLRLAALLALLITLAGGAGFVTILTGAVAQRFMAHSAAMQEPEAGAHATTQTALLHELRDLSERLRRIERALLIETEGNDGAQSRRRAITRPTE